MVPSALTSSAERNCLGRHFNLSEQCRQIALRATSRLKFVDRGWPMLRNAGHHATSDRHRSTDLQPRNSQPWFYPTAPFYLNVHAVPLYCPLVDHLQHGGCILRESINMRRNTRQAPASHLDSMLALFAFLTFLIFFPRSPPRYGCLADGAYQYDSVRTRLAVFSSQVMYGCLADGAYQYDSAAVRTRLVVFSSRARYKSPTTHKVEIKWNLETLQLPRLTSELKVKPFNPSQQSAVGINQESNAGSLLTGWLNTCLLCPDLYTETKWLEP
ncbi:hypothetical protein B0H19DRAFT_1073616 [Mycena capillaripes]|nr:hypothetical protein B0H19DRAFT_1073616 [Mycena capillaripes]